jgi:hypothetical protein
VAGAEIPLAFASLATEKIYVAAQRREVYDALETGLREKLMRLRNIEVVRVLVSEISFDPTYEAQLERKKVADQNKLLQDSQKLLKTQIGIKNQIVQETDDKVKKITSDNNNEIKTKNAENLAAVEAINAEAARQDGKIRGETKEYAGAKEAEGVKAVREAEAFAVQRQREAIGENGENYVAYVAAQNFPVKSVVMPSVGIDWFSPHSLARFVGAAMSAAGARDTNSPVSKKQD